MPRAKRVDQTVRMNLHISESIVAEVSLIQLWGEKKPYGDMLKVVEEALRDWVEKKKKERL